MQSYYINLHQSCEKPAHFVLPFLASLALLKNYQTWSNLWNKVKHENRDKCPDEVVLHLHMLSMKLCLVCRCCQSVKLCFMCRCYQSVKLCLMCRCCWSVKFCLMCRCCQSVKLCLSAGAVGHGSCASCAGAFSH